GGVAVSVDLLESGPDESVEMDSSCREEIAVERLAHEGVREAEPPAEPLDDETPLDRGVKAAQHDRRLDAGGALENCDLELLAGDRREREHVAVLRLERIDFEGGCGDTGTR